jgi:endoglucanase
LWAAASLFRATGYPANHDSFKQLWQARDKSKQVYSLYWWGGSIFACFAYLENPAGDAAIQKEIKTTLTEQCRTVLHVIAHTGYQVALTGNSGPFGYDWGSNCMALGYGLLLLLANEFMPNEQWVAGAASQLNYILGVNPLGKCYISGAGVNPVTAPHHRPSLAIGRTLPGMIGEGANAMNVGGDVALQALFDEGLPYAKRYADDKESYATNEPTIYGNAAFVAVAAWFAR